MTHMDEVARFKSKRSGLVPDVAPPSLLWLPQAIEWVVERTPGLRRLCAQNVVLASTSDSSAGDTKAQLQ